MAYNFDNFVSDASNVFDKIGEKVSGAIDYSKVQIDKASTRSKLKEKYSEVGRLYYETLELGADNHNKIKPLIEEIRELKRQLEKTDDTVSAAQEKTCKFCGTISASSSSYCPKCGEPV
ncbi:MAG: hypothetical protein FWG90_00535 [Oscillospiraceae bacterium]|nr:hypothetical protein [Oscillospiraceae bacterium]